jgi:hypothetical protein
MKILFWLVLSVLRFIVFAVLVFFRPVFSMVLGMGGGLCLFGFLFCLLFARHQQTPLWALLGAGIGATVVMLVYDMILMSVAPEGFVLVDTL